jgi:FMN-binding domain
MLCMAGALAAAEEEIYLAPDAFLKTAFSDLPKPAMLWITPDVKAEAGKILGHPPTKLRERYWSDGMKTAWILEEIGKEELITAGFVVDNGKIDQARVLIYRESRGMEVRYPAFLNQFQGVELSNGHQLSRRIDGISGATLSVWAMSKMARQALYYDSLTRAK